MPPIDGEKSVRVTSSFFLRCRLARLEVNIPEVIRGFRSTLLYMFSA